MVGNAILLYFVQVCVDLNDPMAMEKEVTTFLIDIYNNLLPKNEFEVIVVAVEEPYPGKLLDLRRGPQENFEFMFSRMPWTAIPFSDITSR